MDVKVSEITTQFVTDYLRIDEASEIETSEIEMFMEAAKADIKSMTALTIEEIDELPDMVPCYLLLISDKFDNRNAMIENKASTKNPAVMEIIRRHAKNYV